MDVSTDNKHKKPHAIVWTDADEADVLRALQERPPYFLEAYPGPSTPTWRGYEKAIWDLSEKTREYLKARRKLRGKNAILDEVAKIVQNKRYGKGRQNFVLLLGEYGRGAYGDTLGGLLQDPDAYGHAVAALSKAKIAGFSDAVEQIATVEKIAWIRSSCKAYLKRVAK